MDKTKENQLREILSQTIGENPEVIELAKDLELEFVEAKKYIL